MATYQFKDLNALADFIKHRGTEEDRHYLRAANNGATKNQLRQIELARNQWYEAAAIVRNSQLEE